MSLGLGRNWEMSALWLESILVSDVGDLVGLSIISNERVASTNYQSLVLTTSVRELCLLLPGLTVASLETELVAAISSVGLIKVLGDHWEFSLLLVVLLLSLVRIVGQESWCGNSHGNKSGKNNDLKNRFFF